MATVMEESKSHGRGPRLYHKKSRTGCQRCKQRRVKCDEAQPSCGSCFKHGVECVYVSQAAKGTVTKRENDKPVSLRTMSTRSSSALSPPNPKTFYPSPGSSHPTPQQQSDETDSSIDLPEGEWRRLWEARLLHHSSTVLPSRYGHSQEVGVMRLFTVEEPALALFMAQHRNRYSLLNIGFAHSALNMWFTSTDKQERDELFKLQQTYQIMSSREQRRDVDDLATADPKLLDYISFTALRMLAHSLALVQTLSLDPWEPPIQWLHIGNGVGEIWLRSLQYMTDDCLIKKFVAESPTMERSTDTILSDHSQLAWLLDHPSHPSSIDAQTDQELNDERAREVYGKALGYTCSIMRAIERGEDIAFIIRRIGAFSIWVPIDFCHYVEQKRPRALVILAHFMSLWLDYEPAWLIGKAGEWQIRCIYRNLPVAWATKLDGLFSKFKTNTPGESTR